MDPVQAAQNASRNAVKEVFLHDLKTNLLTDSWVEEDNYYCINTVQRVNGSFKSNTIRKDDLKQYIAASSVIHGKDGWNFLSSSVRCLLHGQYTHAIHLAYYAELRAAMSFLASFGIGVFNRRHCYIDNNGDIVHSRRNGKGTHDFVWTTIQKWANDPNRSSQLNQLIKIEGIPLQAWIAADPALVAPATAGTIASSWLRNWSIDLEQLSDDRDIRNKMSYRPQVMNSTYSYQSDLDVEIKYLLDQWRLCEPSTTSGFSRLDRHLLREAIELAYKGRHGKLPGKRVIKAIYQRMVGQLGVTSNDTTLDFLSRKTEGRKNTILKLAKLNRQDEKKRPRPLSVMSRAFLLLRISTGAITDSLDYAGIDNNDYQVWLQSIGQSNGIWSANDTIADLADLWIDIVDSIQIIEDGTGAQVNGRKDLLDRYHSEVNVLSQKKRAFMWSI